MTDGGPGDVRSGYDAIAGEYTDHLLDELRHKPLDREVLDRFATKVRDLGPACDLGCGPGQVARHLADRGVGVSGVDVSDAMTQAARRVNPGIAFSRADMRSLPFGDDSLGGIAAFYSIIHIPRPEVVSALVEMRRVLRPGGVLLLAFHVGDEVLHRDEMWGKPVSLDFFFFRAEEMAGFLGEAGFVVAEVVEREPYPDVEYPSRRAYVFADKPRRRA